MLKIINLKIESKYNHYELLQYSIVYIVVFKLEYFYVINMN